MFEGRTFFSAQQKTIYGRALKSGFEIELHKSMHYFCARRNHINDVNHSQRFERMQKKHTHHWFGFCLFWASHFFNREFYLRNIWVDYLNVGLRVLWKDLTFTSFSTYIFIECGIERGVHHMRIGFGSLSNAARTVLCVLKLSLYDFLHPDNTQNSI